MPFENTKLLVTHMYIGHKLFSFETINTNWKMTNFLFQQRCPKKKQTRHTRIQKGEKKFLPAYLKICFFKKTPLYI